MTPSEKARAYYAGCKDGPGYMLHARLGLEGAFHICSITWGYPGEWRVSLQRWDGTAPASQAMVHLVGHQGHGSDPDLLIACDKAKASLIAREIELIEKHKNFAAAQAQAKADAAAKAAAVDDNIAKLLGL